MSLKADVRAIGAKCPGGSCEHGPMSLVQKTNADDVVRAAVMELRGALVGYCYGILGSGLEAEDAVQETLLRVWRSAGRFDSSRPLRPWVFAIATHVCRDMAKAAQRKAWPMDLTGPAAPGAPLGPPLDRVWFQPLPDEAVEAGSGDPAEVALRREGIRMALVVVLQRLTPQQRAVFLLRQVCQFTTREVAGILETTPAAVNSALQRARAGLASEVAPVPDRGVDEALLGRYLDRLRAGDVEGLIALMTDDITLSMPPYGWWLAGREDVATALRQADTTSPCREGRYVAVWASGCPAYAHYAVDPSGGHHPFSLTVLHVRDGLLSGLTSYLDASPLFALFGLDP